MLAEHSGFAIAAKTNAHVQNRTSGIGAKKGLICQALADAQIHKFTLLTAELCYFPGQCQQVGTGPAFSVLLIGAAAARQVQARPTTRTKVLNARVISFSYMRVPWERKP
jgi:hypothetical protein